MCRRHVGSVLLPRQAGGLCGAGDMFGDMLVCFCSQVQPWERCLMAERQVSHKEADKYLKCYYSPLALLFVKMWRG